MDNPDTGDKLLVNFVTSTDPGSTCPSDSPAPGCTVTVTDLIPALTITKTANTAAAVPGSTVGYTITVTDTGQTPYTAATATDDLSGVLGDAAYNHDAAATRGSVSFASPNLTWTGDLAPGQAATITYTVTVNNPDTGPGTLSNTVDLGRAGQHLPGREPRPGLRRHRGRGPARSPSPSRPPPAWGPLPPAARSVRAWAPSRSPTTAASVPTGPRRSRPPASPPAPARRPRPSPPPTPSTSSPRWPRPSARPASPRYP